jgi:hypothetical protein
MPAFERFFLDPSAEDLVVTMVEAVETANKRCRKGLLKADESVFRRLAREVLAAPEGVERRCRAAGKGTAQHSRARATLLGVAWWTDPVGRRHVRIVGRRLLPLSEFHLNRFGPPDVTTPPLALIDPEHCFVRHLPNGATPELLVSCECGATGTPGELVWTGGRCGPCHDYEQDNGRPRVRRPFVLARHAAEIIGVAFTESGDGLVTAAQDGVLDVGDPWDHAERTAVTVFEGGHEWEPIAFACNGRHVVMSSAQDGLVRLTAHSGRQLSHWLPRDGGDYVHLALSADGRRLGGAKRAQLDLWDTTNVERPVRTSNVANDVDRYKKSIALSPSGDALAASDRDSGEFLRIGQQTSPTGIISLFDGADLQARKWSIPGAANALSFSPDGTILAVGMYFPAGVELREVETRSRIATFSTGGPIEVLAFAPDGRVLAAAGEERIVHFWDLHTGEALGGLQGHLGTVTALAFSPDGNLLASGGADGLVRLWHWRDLLGMK